MWVGRREVSSKLVAVAIDKDKNSLNALKWATDHILHRGNTVLLLHVKNRIHTSNLPVSPSLSYSNISLTSDINDDNGDLDLYTSELFLPFRCFCTRKDIQCQEVLLEDIDVVKAIVDYVTQAAIEVLILGSPSKGSFLRRFKTVDIPSSVLKAVPDFCTVYEISKNKISSTRAAARRAPAISTLRNQMHYHSNSNRSQPFENPIPQLTRARKLPSPARHGMNGSVDLLKSPGRHRMGSYGEIPTPEKDQSFASSSERPSVDSGLPSFVESFDMNQSPTAWSSGSELDNQSCYDLLQLEPTIQSDKLATSPGYDEVEAEMLRLKMELRKTMEMYSSACKEATTAKKLTKELQQWKIDEQIRLEEARLAEESAKAIIEQEKEKSRAAIEAAKAARRIAQTEAEKRIKAEMKAIKEAEEKDMVLNKLAQSDVKCRKYTIEEIEEATNFFSESRKIGEGGYGPVYKCYLDHTSCAVKVLRPDAAHGRSQFQQEVDVLSCMRHPNMVLLVGSCPEYGCLVYEYMANGTLDDCLFHNGKRPPLTWQQRFRIAAEIATGLLFLHQTKPEPLVHRDLKPGNILLDRNYVAKIGDVGLSRLVPPSEANTATQYRMTSTAGTFCYIDPEYQQTGMLGVKSDVYSLGIMFLQMITAKPPMGLTYLITEAIEEGTFSEFLDSAVPDWPMEETLMFAKLALKCSELRRKDRPDLGDDVLPKLEKLRELAENSTMFDGSFGFQNQSQVSMSQDDMSYPTYAQSQCASSNHSSLSGWRV